MRTSFHSRITKSVILVSCGLMCSCDRVFDWALGHEDISSMVVSLEAADHIVVKDNRLNHVVKETGQPEDIAAVIGLIHKYPTGWKPFASGATGDYDMYFYRGNQLLGSVGMTPGSKALPGQDTVHVGGAFRQVPKEDVTQLTTKLGLKWPTR